MAGDRGNFEFAAAGPAEPGYGRIAQILVAQILQAGARFFSFLAHFAIDFAVPVLFERPAGFFVKDDVRVIDAPLSSPLLGGFQPACQFRGYRDQQRCAVLLCLAKQDTVFEYLSAPIEELLLECGPNNKISGIFWDRKMSVRELFATWPEGKFGTDLKKLEADKPEQEIKVFCDTIWDRGEKRWRMIIWSDRQDAIIFESRSRTCPWLTPRYFRVPGETYGRGVLMLAMPTIKTVNTVARLQLQAAAIAMLGIYTAVDDGVFNPDLAPTEPGVFWKVARNGGALGPSVARFPDPRLDLSSMVMKDMQTGVKSTMMDQSLPPDGAAVRSATEILERVKRLASDHLGAYGRLVKEVVVPAVKRVIELAYNKGLLSSEIDIDQLLVRVRVKSPIALAREATKIQRIVQWLEIVVSMAGAVGQPGVARYVAKIEEALTDIGRRLGVDEAFIVSVEERAKLKQQDQEQALALAAAGAAGAAA